jgi:hypothetical protein
MLIDLGNTIAVVSAQRYCILPRESNTQVSLAPFATAAW